MQGQRNEAGSYFFSQCGNENVILSTQDSQMGIKVQLSVPLKTIREQQMIILLKIKRKPGLSVSYTNN